MSRVLVVEDDDLVRGMLEMTLQRAGYETEPAADGDEAIRRHRERPADLVITDIVMPGREGLGTIMEMRREWPDLPVIAISGGGHNSPDTYLAVARKLGASRTFQKPVDRDGLLAAVRDILAAS
jgi:DNA-binding NtrC family response regulator